MELSSPARARPDKGIGNAAEGRATALGLPLFSPHPRKSASSEFPVPNRSVYTNLSLAEDP